MEEDNNMQYKLRKKKADLWMWISFAFWWMCGFIAYGLLETIIK